MLIALLATSLLGLIVSVVAMFAAAAASMNATRASNEVKAAHDALSAAFKANLTTIANMLEGSMQADTELNKAYAEAFVRQRNEGATIREVLNQLAIGQSSIYQLVALAASVKGSGFGSESETKH